MQVLKKILDNFSLATGLDINFHKSTFVPLNVDTHTAAAMADVLGCFLSSFPQTYLGLPLSPHKLRVSDYQPLLTSFDRYLAGWKARLLSSGGRLVLVNAVLGSLPIYYMSSILLPKTVRDMLDAKRRAFFWTGEEKCSGASCLVSWDRVCLSRGAGGLGVKNLEDANHCLLMKFVHKLHSPATLPWQCWFHSHSGPGLLATSDSYLAKLVLAVLPLYRTLTKVTLGDGASVSFWHDRWLLDSTLVDRFPALHSHSTDDMVTIRAVITDGLLPYLRPRLTRTAAAEHDVLASHLSQVTLTASHDVRLLATMNMQPFTSRGAYHLLHDSLIPSDVVRIWSTRLPAKVKFFAWLLYHGRLNTRAHLFHRNIKTHDESKCEYCVDTLETDVHIFVECPRAQAVWSRLRFVVHESTLRRPWNVTLPSLLPGAVKDDVMILIFWHIWKARNAKIFDHRDSSPTEVLRHISADIDAWSCRYRKLAVELHAWHEWIVTC